jgi:hypothetical protein
MTFAAAGFEDNLAYFHWGSLEGSSWFDDISLTAGPISAQEISWGSVKTGYSSDEEE